MRQTKLSEIKSKNKFTPLMATFRGGKKEPFHNWYPLIEGYSPEFVKIILNGYMPDSKNVFDPFGGTVTTGFSSIELNKNAFFCEINPFLQFLANIKGDVRLLDNADRKALHQELVNLSKIFPKSIMNFEKDTSLIKSYKNVFNKSQFFGKKPLDEILSAKSFINQLKGESGIISNLLCVAVLSSLIPCSFTKRQGDLRYKTPKELERGLPEFTTEVQKRLIEIAKDILHENARIKQKPVLVCENAKDLDKIPFLNIDALITSPPYINGTNYFRNTKLELWFLECLRTKNDLKNYRKNSLTAGINDVQDNYETPDIDIIKDVVTKLERCAYDVRIPKMISGYFSELQDIFKKITNHLCKNSKIAIDIGDSRYAGIHVPTDLMLIEILKDIGFRNPKTIKLRERFSKDKTPLRQVLLLFEWSG